MSKKQKVIYIGGEG